MLDSVVEFITQAASSSAFIFCFCNLIIVIILVDLKPSLSVHQESEIPVSVGINQKQGTSSKCLVHSNTGSPQAAEGSHAQEAAAVDKIETEGNGDCSNEEEEKEEDEDEDEEEDQEDDELRRRVEEFIEKVNKGWKAELLNTSSLV